MKNLNLIKRLWTDSHEKQSPQRFVRYAAMLIMLLTLGVGQMWAAMYVPGYGGSWGTTSNAMSGSGPWTFTAYWSSAQEFKIHDGTNWIGSPSGSNPYLLAFGTEYTLTTGGGNNMKFSSVPSDGGRYKITVRKSGTKYYLTATKEVEEGSTAYSISSSPYIYFNVAAASSTYTAASILLGKSDGSQDYPMSGKISGTQLFYKQMPDWSNYKTFLFIDANNWGGNWNSQKVTERIGGATNTNTYNTGMSGNYHMFTVASGDDNAALSYTSQTTYGALLNKTQTVEVYAKTVGGSYTKKTSSWPGTLTPDRYYMSSATATTHDNSTALTASSSVTVSAVLTSAFSLSESSTDSGYDFDGWGTSSSDTPSGKNSPYSISSIEGANTICAFFTEKAYDLTFTHNGHGTIAVGGNTVSSGSTAKANYYTTKTLAATANTGYRFTGWSKSGSNTSSVTIADMTSTGTSTTIKATNTGATITAGFEAKTYTITLDDNGDYEGDGEATATYNSSTLSFSSHASRTDYRIDGYQTSGGTKVINADGSLVASVSGYTNSSSEWIKDDDVTLYAIWVYDVTNYTVTYGVGTSYTSLGSLSAYNNSTSAALGASPQSVRSGHSVTFTASPNTGYTVEGWYTNAACDAGKHDAGSLTYTTSIGGNTTVYVKFVEKTWSVAFAAGAGGSVTTPNSSPQTVGQLTGISIAATPSDGYTFSSWSSSSGGSFVSGTSTNSNTFKPTANTTVTASFSTIIYTITYAGMDGATNFDGAPSNYTVESSEIVLGTPTKAHYKFAGWTSGGSPITSIAAGSTGNLTLTANWTALPKVYLKNTMNWDNAYITFYNGDYWGDGANAAGSYTSSEFYVSGPTAMTYNTSTGLFEYECPDIYTYIYACFTKDQQTNYGNFYETEAIYLNNTLQYEKVAIVARETNSTINNTKYYTTKTNGNLEFVSLASGEGTGWFFPGGWSSWETKGNEASWNSTNVRWTKSLSANTNYSFKVYNHGVYYGNSGTYSESGSKTFTSGGSNCTLSTTIAGTYTFDYNTSTNSLTISYPEVYAISGSFNSWTEVTNLDFSDNDGTYEVTINGSTTNYEFKILNHAIWYGIASKTFTGTETNVATTKNSNNIKLTADIYPSGSYTFAFNKSTNKLGVTYPDSYNVTFGQSYGGAATTATANSVAISSNKKIVAAAAVVFTHGSASTGYQFKGWYDNESGTGDKLVAGNPDTYTISSLSAKATVYAVFEPRQYAITFDATTNGGAITSGTSPQNVVFDETSVGSCPTAAKEGYCFDGWYTAATSGTKIIDAEGNLQPNVTVSATQWTDGTGKWKKDGTATVYAVYVKPEIIMTQGGKGLISSMPGYDTLIVNQSFGCTPAADYNISYTVGYKVSHTQLAPQPKINYCAAAVAGVRHDTIIMPVADGANSYEVVAYLKTGTTRGSGTDVTTDTLNVDVETSYAVKVRAVVDGVEIAEERLALLYPSFAAISVTIWKEIKGYELDHIELGVGVTEFSRTERDDCYWIRYYAANASSITAVYKPKANTVYLFNTSSNCMYAATRTKLYDYGTSGYWAYGDYAGKGAGSTGLTGDTVIATDFDSPIWMASIGATTTHFAFTSDKLNNYSYFYSYTASNGTKLPAHVIYRTDYNAALPMFVPVVKNADDCYELNSDANGKALYYRGFWVKRSPDLDSTGYVLKVYNKKTRADEPYAGSRDPEIIQTVPFRLTQTGEDGTWELTAAVDLEANKTYGFKYTKATGASSVAEYGNNGTMESNNQTDWLFETSLGICGLTTTAAGDYTFHLHCVNYGTKAANVASDTDVQGKLVMTVDYAAKSGDFRVIYSDDTQTEVISSPSIRPRANGQDTVSFFIREDDTNRVMKIQKFTTSWADFGDPVDLSGIAKDSVYVIYLQQDEDMTTIEATGIDFYDGDYYIRTDCVDEYKWDYKKSLDNHRMIPTDYGMTAKQPDKFSHYFVHWIEAGKNVKFIVANKYAPCLSDTVIKDAWVTDAGGNLGDKGANIRFMYNKGTNVAMRAYLYGSQENDDDYLKLTKTSGSMTDRTSAITEITFTDLGNFTYQAEIAAQPGLRGKLTAEYLDKVQYFLGSAESDEQLIGGSGSDWQNILLTYDFKSNRLICAWQPSGATITEDLDINADILIIRKAQGDAQQIRFSGSTKIGDVHYIYGVIEFEYNSMYHMMYSWDYWSYAQCMYYISFPFDVLVNDITGVGALGTDWRIQRYNGAKRAEVGWFADGPQTFWEDIHAGDTLKAYEGYSLLLNRSRFNGTAGNIWDNKHAGDKVYLYFPSVSPMVGALSNETISVTVPSHPCNINRTFEPSTGMVVNHKITDSHWNMIGTPMFADTTAFSIQTGLTPEGASEPLQYVYAWNYYGNTLGIQLTLNTSWRFKTMYSYMAQYCGDIVFHGPAIHKSVAAKRTEEKKNYHLNLEISKDDMFIGRTYVELRENAVDSFLLNEDVYMVRNGVNADLFTYAGTYETGANVLPIADQIVQVGVAVKQAGTYTFSMPDHFDGEVILVDKYAQTRTNLAIEDYEIALPKGNIIDRFELEININKVPTAIDGVSGGSFKDGKAHKFIENDMMYILKDGVLYDARGNRVK